MHPSPTPHSPGESFGPYVLERLLGRGAAAEVWQATETGDMGFTKRQALKLLQPPPGEMEAQKNALINEARVCGHLKHPGVVDVYRVGEQDGELYIAMEFVDGPDLNTLLVALRDRGMEIPLGAAVDAAIDLCDALEYAHATRDGSGQPLDIVHRDLKPSNVLVDRRGVLKISDWGLVKSTLNIESTTRGIVKGTPGYIAPEVWGGTRDFRPAADLFAVGAMLYEFVVGERLFRGRNLARIAEQVARRKPAEEAARVGERCPELVPVVERVLQRVPSRRHQTAAELGEALRTVREQLPPRESLRRFLREVTPLIDEVAPVESSGPVPRDQAMSQAVTPRLDSADSAIATPARPAEIGPKTHSLPGPDTPRPPAAKAPPASTPPFARTPAPLAGSALSGPTAVIPVQAAASPSALAAGSALSGPTAVIPTQSAASPSRAAAGASAPRSAPKPARAPPAKAPASPKDGVSVTRMMSPSASLTPSEKTPGMGEATTLPDPVGALAEGEVSKPRRRKRRPAPERRKGRGKPPPTAAVVILVGGTLLLLLGLVAVILLRS